MLKKKNPFHVGKQHERKPEKKEQPVKVSHKVTEEKVLPPPSHGMVEPSPKVSFVKTVPAPVVVAVPVSSKLKVVETISLSFRGQHITLSKGDVIRESSYGTNGLKMLMDAGVKIEKV